MTGENFRRNESSNDSSEQGTRPVYGDGELGPVGDRWRVRGTLRFEIEPDGAGTRFTLSNVFDDIGKAARDAAGWHSCLDALERELDGAPAPARSPREQWERLNRAYAARFGPEASTIGPPPGHPYES